MTNSNDRVHQLLVISLFGGVRVELNGEAQTNWASRKAEALIAYLAHTQQIHEREILATLLWDNRPLKRSLANLSVVLSSIRQAVGEPFLISSRQSLGLNWERPLQVDTTTFAQQVEQLTQRTNLNQNQLTQLAKALDLYTGEFLSGLHLRQAQGFEEWALLEREYLQQLMMNGLATLVQGFTRRRNFQEAITHARQLLALDPLRETTQRDLMRLLALTNQRGQALAQYEQCVQVLRDELGVPPGEKTVALFEQIRDGRLEDEIVAEAVTVVETLTDPKNNLPAATSSFIGRTAEQSQIDTRLANPACRLLTVVGFGGVGKTRLAIQAARAQLTKFLDGVWFVSLDGAENIPGPIAEVLDLSLSGADPLEEQVIAQLKEKELLLVLDNLEHLLDQERTLAFVSRLLVNAPAVKLLVTSRERLNLQAEWLLELDGLPYPHETAAQTPEQLTRFAAVQLFLARVGHIQPGSTPTATDWTAADWAAVSRICHLVAGHPLALELAAAWSRLLSLAEIAAEIEENIDFLASSMPDLAARHQSVRAVLAYSWRLLSAEEQQTICRLAVFKGGFTREAAKAVASASLLRLSALMNKSFVRRDEGQRYRQHPLLIQFAQQMLTADAQLTAETRERHGRYFANFVQQQEEALKGAEAQTAIQRITADIDNVLAAWQWGLGGQQYTLLLRMINSLSIYYFERSQYLSGRTLFAETLTALETAAADEAAAGDRATLEAKLLITVGRFLYQTGRYKDAAEKLTAGLAKVRHLGLTTETADALTYLGDVYGDQGEHEKAFAHLQDAAVISRQLDEPFRTIMILNGLGNSAVSLGRYDQALTYFHDGLAIAEEIGHQYRIASFYNNMAIVANRREDYHEAIRLWDEARRRFQAIDHQWGLAVTSHNIGMAYTGLKEYEKAQTYVEQALQAHRDLGHRRGMTGGLAVLGVIHRGLGQLAEARRYFRQGLRLARDVDVRWVAVSIIVEMGILAHVEERPLEAYQLISFALSHDALTASSREEAAEKREEVAADLTAEQIEAAETTIATWTLETVYEQLLD